MGKVYSTDNDTEVLRPRFSIEFVTEDSKFQISYKPTDTPAQEAHQGVESHIQGVAMEESIISLATKNAMEDDSAVFSFVIVGDTYWDRLLNPNDAVILRIFPGGAKENTYNPVLLSGLISDVRLEGDYGANAKMYRITGHSMAKALLSYDVGVLQDISIGLSEVGWLVDEANQEKGGIPFSGSTAVKTVSSILERFVRRTAKEDNKNGSRAYMEYNFVNGKGITDYLVWNQSEDRWNSWGPEYEFLLAPDRFINFDGSLKEMMDVATGRPFNELFVESTVEGKSEIVMRKTPFNPEQWNALPVHKIGSEDVIKESVGKSDMEAYSIFHVRMATIFGSLDTIGFGAFPRYHPELVKKYGYRALDIESLYLSGMRDLDEVEAHFDFGADNGGDGDSSDGGTGTAVGGDNPEKMWNFFRSSGFSEASTAGILANSEAESGIDPTKWQVPSGPAMGAFQWEGTSSASGANPYGRFANLVSFAKNKGKSWKDLQVQCEFLIHEMNGGDPTTKYLLGQHCGGLSGFKKLTDPGRASDVFMWSFERPKDQTPGRRSASANKWYNKFKGKKVKKRDAFGAIYEEEEDILKVPQDHLVEHTLVKEVTSILMKYNNASFRINANNIVRELVEKTDLYYTDAVFVVDRMKFMLYPNVEAIAEIIKEAVAETRELAKKTKTDTKPTKVDDRSKPTKTASYKDINKEGTDTVKRTKKLDDKGKKEAWDNFQDDLKATYKDMTKLKASNIRNSYEDDGKLSREDYDKIMKEKEGSSGTVNGDNEGAQAMKFFNELLYNWYCENPNFYSGEIVVLGHPSYRIGTRLMVYDDQNGDTWEYYVESVQHEFSYGEGYKTTLGVTRGLPHSGRYRFSNMWGKSKEFKGGLMGEPSIEELNKLSKEQLKKGKGDKGGDGESSGGGSTGPLTGTKGSKIAMKAVDIGLKHEKGKTKWKSYYDWGGGRDRNMFNGENPIHGDCSSFVFEIFNQAGYEFSCKRGSATTWSIKADPGLKTVFTRGQKSKGMLDKMRIGDIIWFGPDDYHIGVYIGGNRFIGLQGTPKIDHNGGIKTEDLLSDYWWSTFNGDVKRL